MKYLVAFALLLASTAWAAEIPSSAWVYRDAMKKSAWRTFGLDAPVATLAAQIHQESAWDINAISAAGAQSLAQFMPGTAADMAARFPSICAPANPFNPVWAFQCRDKYLKTLITAIHNNESTECDDWALGLRAYNGGLGWIRKDQRLAAMDGANPNDWQELAPYNSGRRFSAWRENTEYPVRIFKLEPIYKPWGRVMGCGQL